MNNFRETFGVSYIAEGSGFDVPEYVANRAFLDKIPPSFTSAYYTLKNSDIPLIAKKIKSAPFVVEEQERRISEAVYTEVQVFDAVTNKYLALLCYDMDGLDNMDEFQILCIYYDDSRDTIPITDILTEFANVESSTKVEIKRFVIAQNGVMATAKKMYHTLEDMKKYKKEFYPYIDVDKMFKTFLQSDESILIVTSKPGLGKSKLVNVFLRFLLENDTLVSKKEAENISVYYVKNEAVLAVDEFWNTMMDSLPDVVVLDDIEFFLTHRSANVASELDNQKNKFISNLLSTTDGVFDKTKKTKFIITTNLSVDELDTALLRKGRMFDILKLRTLTFDEAKHVWDAYALEQSFEQYFTAKNDMSEKYISAAEIGSIVSRLKRVKTKEQEKDTSYLLEPGISILHRDQISTGKNKKSTF